MRKRFPHNYIQAVNDEGGDVNVAFDHQSEKYGQTPTDTIPNVAKRFKARSEPWCLIVDENYGEGSAREHAALQPRFYGEHTAYAALVVLVLIEEKAAP